jgi:K+/H+ antiporter YhaU regulatory subunit KhtT
MGHAGALKNMKSLKRRKGMKKPTLWQRVKYQFDNLMSKGTISLLLILGVITAVTVLVGGIASILLGGPDGTGGESAGSTIWFTLMHAINTGVLAKEEGTVAYLFVMTIVTLVGIFITSFLIGTVSNGIKEKVTELQRGKSRVIEKDHVVIIGFDENVTSILEELVYANENQKDAVVVLMADHDKTDMEDTIRDRISDLGNLRVVCRSGKPDLPKDLKVCSLDTCKSIIVNLADDFMTIKTILACENLLNEYGNKEAYITATVRDRDVLQPAKIAGGDRAEILNFHKTMARLMVQAGRHPGMSEILSELLSFKGNEIYVEDAAPAVGLTLSEINLRLPHSTAIGIVRGDEPILNPGADVKVQTGDGLIMIAQDDEGVELQAEAAVDKTSFQYEASPAEEPQTLLILGYSDLLKQILIEENAYAVPGSKVIVAVEPGKIDEEELPDATAFSNISLELRECKIFSRRTLERLVAEKPSCILLLADTGLPAEEADARTLMLQLQLTDISDGIGIDIPLTIEMNSTRNQKLSQMMRGTDFVVSSRITAKMMAHIAEERHKKTILNDLLSEGGSSIYMKPASRYVQIGKPVDFYTLGASAARYGEIAIGYKKFGEDDSFLIEVNPRSRAAAKFSERDDVIVVARSL